MQRSNKARDFILLFGTAEEAVEKRFFCALRFSSEQPEKTRPLHSAAKRGFGRDDKSGFRAIPELVYPRGTGAESPFV